MVLSRRRWLPSNLLLLFLLDTVAADALDFSLYPTDSQSCLYAAATSSACDHSTVAKFNACVCSNGGGFLDSAASCLGSSDEAEVSSVYSTMSTNCGNSNTPIAFSADQWVSIASGSLGSSTAAASSSTAALVQTTVQTVTAPTGSTQTLTITQSPSAGQTSAVISVVTLAPGQTTQLISVITLSPSSTSTTASQSNSAAASGSHIGTGAIAGIVIGGAAIFAIASIVLFFLLRRRKTKQDTRPEAHPFMGPGTGAGGDEGKNYIQLQSYSKLPPAQGTEAEKYQQQFQQYPATMPYGQAHPHPYGPLGYNAQQPYGGAYNIPQNGNYAYHGAAPLPGNGAVELAGQPGVPFHTHELPAS